MDPAAGGNCAIRNASLFGRLEIVQFLLRDRRVDPSSRSNNAIRLASRHGHLTVVEALLQDPRVDPSDNENEAIILAFSKQPSSSKAIQTIEEE